MIIFIGEFFYDYGNLECYMHRHIAIKAIDIQDVEIRRNNICQIQNKPTLHYIVPAAI